jgi:hypothetical protein
MLQPELPCSREIGDASKEIEKTRELALAEFFQSEQGLTSKLLEVEVVNALPFRMLN